MEQSNRLTNPYKQGADEGFLFGIYMSALFFASAYALDVPMLGILATGMILAIPAILFMLLRRTWNRDNGMTLFSGMWMQGIMVFICGALISGAVSFAYLRWINPGWLASQVRHMIDLYAALDGGAVIADTLSKIMERGLLPSPIQMVIQMLWFEVFAGSILTLIVTLIVRAFRPRPAKTDIQ